MKQQLQNVRDFHIVSNSHRERKPTKDIPEEIKESRIRLLSEECREAVEAIKHEDIDQIAKELTDVIYVTLGAIEAFGLSDKFEDIFRAVHESNMSKLQGGATLDATGKVSKSASYKKPDIKAILAQ